MCRLGFAVLSLALVLPLSIQAQTQEIQDEIEARLHALRTAAPLVVPGPASVVAGEEAAINALTARIDRRLQEFWDNNKIRPSDRTTDAEFLRRVSLDLLGRIPSVQEVRQFVASNDPKKREKKVSELLGKAGHFNHLSTVLRQQWLPQSLDNPQFQFVGFQFETWLRNQLRQNVGFDKIVRDVLTAPTLFARNQPALNRTEAGNTPFGFNQVNEFKPENVAASASRLFMGVKMECAQCHDHPFAPISREQFWETAAFFADLQPAIAQLNEVKLKREIRIIDPDPKKAKLVQAKFFDETEPTWKDSVSPRETFADWLIAPKNKWFARNSVQRVWSHFFGIGFIDPIDEPGLENPELVPELVNEMAKAFAESKHDLRFLIKAITRSKAYQLSSRQTDPSQSNPRHFARMNVKAMTAEQLFDSLALATGYNEPTINPQQRQFAQGPRRDFLTKFASTEKITERQTSILQALTLMNGKFVNDQTNLDRSQFLSGLVDAPFLEIDGKLEVLFMAALSRQPTADETAKFGSYVQRGGIRINEGDNAIVIRQGSTISLQMKEKPLIQKVRSEKPEIIFADTGAQPNSITVRGEKVGTSQLVLTAADGSVETFEIIVQNDQGKALADVFWALLNSSEFILNH